MVMGSEGDGDGEDEDDDDCGRGRCLWSSLQTSCNLKISQTEDQLASCLLNEL